MMTNLSRRRVLMAAAQGPIRDVLTPDHIAAAFDVEAMLLTDPTGTSHVTVLGQKAAS